MSASAIILWMPKTDKCPKCGYSAQVTFGLLGVCVRCGTHPHQFERDKHKARADEMVGTCMGIIDSVSEEASEEGSLWLAKAKAKMSALLI